MILYQNGIINVSALVAPLSAFELSQSRANNVKYKDQSETLSFSPSQNSNDINILGSRINWEVGSPGKQHVILSQGKPYAVPDTSTHK